MKSRFKQPRKATKRDVANLESIVVSMCAECRADMARALLSPPGTPSFKPCRACVPLFSSLFRKVVH